MHPCTYGFWLGLGHGFLHHFQQYFSYIVVISFIGGKNHDLSHVTMYICVKPTFIFVEMEVLCKTLEIKNQYISMKLSNVLFEYY